MIRVKQNNMVLFNIIEKGKYGLLNPITRKLHRINETGRFIWEKCIEPRDTAELAGLLSQNFQILEDAAQRDVQEFVERMVSFQLFEEV